MTELSHVLRDVLRALGVEGWERAGLRRGLAEPPREPGDLHDARLPEEFQRG